MANGITLSLSGLSDAINRLNNLGSNVSPIIGVALNQVHEEMMTLAKERTPVDTGALRASGHVIPPTISGGKVKSVGGFGGTSVNYAIMVHENLNVHHRVGQAKFYESAVNDKSDKIIPTIRIKILTFMEEVSR